MGRKKIPEAAKLTLDELAAKIEDEAAKKGLSENYFFKTTFERYKVQLDLLHELKKAIDQEGMLVEKTYVKDRPSIVINPAITEYNKTASAANGTVSTLIKILSGLSEDGTSRPADAMADFLNS